MASLSVKVILELLIFLVVFFVNGAESREGQVCSSSLGRIPRGRNRICTVSTAGLFWREECEYDYEARQVTGFSAYIGMTLSVACLGPVGVGQKVGLYKGNKTIGSHVMSSSHTFTNLQVQDTGQYECRVLFDNGTWVSSIFYNITASAGM